jgi:hypothetical protein
MLITRDRVAVQLSARVLRYLDRDLHREKDDEDGLFARVIKGAVLGGLRELLDHSIECPLDELRDVRYRDGRLELIAKDGDRVLEDLKINDREVLESFSDADARAFVHEFRRLKGRDH